ncbi:Radical SAM superfamily protein [Sporotomaculum syntrophicum]|uniref:Radical SAM superfamily protein n=1 Tax=Sporotomaculum syntrophicum TaxID=182264 RepID=A0A9D3AWX1_9FIRM|nr:Radical SAM superfamily protein [Sporotomaculum syntrophicum]
MSLTLLKNCTLCPRDCQVDRTRGQRGYCRQTEELVVARAALHMWEEPCLSGANGSGAVFFSGCSLGCVYCQNYNIAQGLAGKPITIARLADIFLELQRQAAHNINLVTPSHYVPQIIEALILARGKGLVIPIVYNCSGYEKIETLRLLEGYVDIYLPDCKYWSREVARKYSHAEEYFAYASAAITEMVRQTDKPVINEEGLMTRGVLVRHLTLPGYLEDSKLILKYLYETFGDKILLSIMNQYTPLPQVNRYPEINRRVTEQEYNDLVDYAIAIGIENGFIQQGDTASESFIPEFNCEGV